MKGVDVYSEMGKIGTGEVVVGHGQSKREVENNVTELTTPCIESRTPQLVHRRPSPYSNLLEGKGGINFFLVASVPPISATTRSVQRSSFHNRLIKFSVRQMLG